MENNKHKKSGLKNQTAGYMLFQVNYLEITRAISSTLLE